MKMQLIAHGVLAVLGFVTGMGCFNQPKINGGKLQCMTDDGCLAGYVCTKRPGDVTQGFGKCVKSLSAVVDSGVTNAGGSAGGKESAAGGVISGTGGSVESGSPWATSPDARGGNAPENIGTGGSQFDARATSSFDGGGLGGASSGSSNSTGTGGLAGLGGVSGKSNAGGSSSATGGTAGSQNGSGGAAGGQTGTVVPSPYPKPRIIATSDGEVDDRDTMIRFLMYSSDYDIKGIVQVNSRYQKNGHSKQRWVEKKIELYGQVLPNLKKHNPNYPDLDESIVKVGNENINDLFVAPASMETKETQGSRFILENILDDDPRQLHVPSWGGANTTAYALYTLKTSYPEKLSQAASKLWVYCTWYQDNGGQWIEDNIPEVHIYEAYRWDNIWDYQSLIGPNPDDVKMYMTTEWLNENVKINHGTLGQDTSQSYVSESDTPSWLALINNGLYQHMNYTWGGWGGRPAFDKQPASNHMTDMGVTSDDGNEYKPYWRWIITAENDFAGRMDWAVANTYEKANHNPKAQVIGSLQREVVSGETATLDASPTTDPDGNNLTFKWWQYYDADSASAKVTIENDNAKTGASFKVPSESGKQIHIILEVTDDGNPPMTNYQRVIFNIK